MSRLILGIVLILVCFPCLNAFSEENSKNTSTVFIVGGGKAARSFANDLARDQMMISGKKAEIRALEKKIDAGEYVVAIQGLTERLDAKGWKFFDREILEALVRANVGAGNWDDAIRYQREIMTRSVKGVWAMQYIADYWRLMEEYKHSIPGGTFEEKIPVSEQELAAYQERLQKFYVGKTENNKDYLLSLANFYMVRLELDKAERYVKQAIDIPTKKDFQKREDKEAHAMLRDILMLQGRYEDANKENEWLITNHMAYGYEKGVALFLQKAIVEKTDPKKIEYKYNLNNFQASVRK